MEIMSPQPLEQGEALHRKRTDFPYRSRAVIAIRPAGFIRRAIAYLFDLLVIFTAFFLFIYSGMMGMRFSGGMDLFLDSGTHGIFILSFLFLYTGYFSFFHAYGGQTPAKMIMRIIVVNKNGLPPSHFRALMRGLSLFLSHLFFGVGFLLVIIEPKKRALHDLLTGTQVMLAP